MTCPLCSIVIAAVEHIGKQAPLSVKWLKSPKMPKEGKDSRITRAKSNLITESLILMSYKNYWRVGSAGM